MKINGQQFVTRNYKTAHIRRPGENGEEVILSLRIGPLPMGWRERMIARGVFMPPEAPKTALKDARGMFQKDEQGLALVYRNTEDHGYRVASNLFTRRAEALMLVEHLREESSVTFDSPEPGADAAPEKCLEFADAVLEELKASGFTDAEIGKLLEIGAEAADAIDTKAVIGSF